MKTLRLTALLTLTALGCGGAADAELFEPGPTAVDGSALLTAARAAAAAHEPDAADPEPATAARAPRPAAAPAEPEAPAWRSCETDDDCELRTSVCGLLTEDGRGRVCRDPRLELGETCEHDNACELGLYCRRLTTSPVYECTTSGAGLGPMGTSGARQPLSCSPDPRTQVDAGCEEVTDD